MTATAEFEVQLAGVVYAQPVPKRYLVALSGGVDSTVLLHALMRILPAGATVVALHGNHQISSDSSSWAAHCETQCKNLGIEFVCVDLVLATHGNLEAAARDARYAFFANYMDEGDLLLLGHHAQDQVETLFLRMFQGRGVISMRQQGVLGPGQFLRPLLNLSRADLVTYAEAIKATWIEDPSNDDTRFDRNFLRHEVIPLLQKRWPRMVQALLRVISSTRAQDALLRHLLTSFPDQVPTDVLPADPASKLLWLRTYLSLRGHYELSDRALFEWLRQVQNAEQATFELGDAGLLRSWRGSLYYSKQRQLKAFDAVVLALGESVLGGFGCLELAQCNATEPDAFVYTGPVEVVCRDQIENVSLNRSFGSASLKALFQQGNIPPWRRAEYPLITQAGELLAIPGIASQAKPEAALAPAHSSVWCRGILRN